MGNAFSLLSSNTVTQIIEATSNPFVGFFIGILATAILQSSSTITSTIVAIVSVGTISLDSAIPIVMGANIGTTVTSTIVSLGYISKKKEFRRALAAAAVHDFFNIFTVLILLPLQYFTGFLSLASKNITHLIYSPQVGNSDFFSYSLKPISNFIYQILGNSPILMIGLALFLLFYAIKSFTQVIKEILIGDSKRKMSDFIFGSPLKSLAIGTLFTAALQSSSVTTSLIVPLAATNKISLKQTFNFIMGANVGTT
ncbi:MAG: Na/Pi symporter, partial [Bacteroidota bacterium]